MVVNQKMPNKIPFHVTHVSGQDEMYKAIELNMHSPTTKGWQSSRFSLYPQEIVIELEKKVRIKKIQLLSHQYLIASKVEFYVGDVPEGDDVNLEDARYTRLGYVALSDNEASNCRARELKSVHVDATGTFVKFIVHKNHVNKYNIYNQVGIVALNIIGDNVDNIKIIDDSDADDSLNQKLARATIGGGEQISAMDDLAFDMYQDPEVAQIIRKLELKKQVAVNEESYEYAKQLKFAILELQKIGEQVGKHEVEKRQAVENEDYDKAKELKDTINEERLGVYKSLNLHELLDDPNLRIERKLDVKRTRTPLISERRPPIDENENTSLINPEEIPLPINNEHLREQKIETPRDLTPYEDRPLLAGDQKAFREANDDEDGDRRKEGGVAKEEMSDRDQRAASATIDVFELPLVTKCYSKLWSQREEGLREVMAVLMSKDKTSDKDTCRSILKATLFLVNRSLKDKVLSVFNTSTSLLKTIYTEFIPKHKLGRSETTHASDKTLPILLQRFGDTALRVRESATNFILESSSFPDVKHLHLVPLECLKPFKLSLAPRTALKRVDLVVALFELHGLDNSGMNVNSVMAFCNEALKHTAGEVRESAESLVIELYKRAGQSVRDWLPPDDDRTRRNVMYKLLFEAFDKIDGVPTKQDKKKAQAAKQKELQELQDQLAHVREVNSELEKQGKGKPPGQKKELNKAKNKRLAAEPEEPTSTADKICIFCNEENDSFLKTEGLDSHYFRHCPMLKRCKNCNTVVEISGLVNHLLTECSKAAGYKRCPLCSEAILSGDLEKHLADKKHTVDEENKSHCPLCHRNFTPIGEDGWKHHLMSDANDSCKLNPRRQESLNRIAKAGSKSNKIIKKPQLKK